MSSFIVFLIVIGVVAFFVFRLYKKYIKFPLNNITLVNGGVGSGKTTLCISLALKKYRSNLIRWYLLKVFLPFKKIEKPLLYSSQPLKRVNYVPLTPSLLLGVENFAPRSVVIWTEASLSADSNSYSMDYQKEFVQRVKLFRHATLGGYMFIDTQCIRDLNLALKRCINSYVWIEKFTKIIPFILTFRIRVMMFNDDTTINISNDVQNQSRLLFVFKKVWKKFDSYNYYGLYKNIPVNSRECYIENKKDLISTSFFDLSNFKKNKNKK